MGYWVKKTQIEGLRTNKKEIINYKFNFAKIKKNDKFRDLIKLWISLINEIKGLIEKISKFRVNLGQNCKKLKSKDRSEYVMIL